MNCDKFEQRIHFLLDRRQRAELDAQLLAHALGCSKCRQMLEVQEALFDGLELFEIPEVSHDFTTQVLSQLPAPRRSTKRPARWIVALTSVAALMVMALLPWNQPNANQSPSLTQLPHPHLSGSLTASQPTVIANRRQRVGVVKPRVVTVARELDFAKDYRSLLDNIAKRIPPVPAEAYSVERLPSGIHPVATCLGVAVTLIRDTFPHKKRVEIPPPPQAALPMNVGMHGMVS